MSDLKNKTKDQLIAEIGKLQKEKINIDFIENANDLIQNVDLEGRLTYVNKKWLQTLDYNKSEVKKLRITDVLRKDQTDKVMNLLQAVANGGKVDRIKLVFISKSGKEIYVEGNGNGVFVDGRFSGAIGIFRDITKHKLLEHSLTSERNKAQNYLDIAGVMMIALDTKGVVTLANKKACEVFGYSESEMIGKNWFDNFLIEKDKKNVKEGFNKIISGELKQLEYFENKIVTRSGETRDIEWHNSTIKDDQGNITGTLSSGGDITERIEAELKIKQQTEDLTLTNKLNESVRAGADLKELISLFSNETRKIFDCLGATVYLLDSKKENLVLQNMTLPGSLQNSIKKYIGIKIPEVIIPFSPGSFYFEALKNNSPEIFNETTIAQKLIEANVQTTSIKNETIRKTIIKTIPAIKKLLKIKSYIMVPLTAINELSGFVGFSGTNIFSDKELERITGIVSSFNTIINKKNVGIELEQSEENLKALIENREESIWSIDKNYNYVTFNKYYSEAYLIAYNVKLQKGINALEILTPKLRKLWKEKYDLALKGTRTNFEFDEFIFETLHYFDVSLNPIFTGNEISGVSALSIDITEQKNNHILLEETELRFRTIFEQAHDAIILMDTETNMFTEFNNITCKMLGYTRDEFFKLELNDVEAKENPEETQKHLKKIMKDGSDVFESKYRKKNGKIIDIIISAKKLILRNKVFVLGIWRDITQQNISLLKIIESEEKFRLLAHHSFEWEYWIDSKGNYIFVSESCERISGITAEQYADNPQLFFKIIHPDYKTEVTKHFHEEYNKSEMPFSMEFTIERSDGSERWIEHNCNPVFDSDGKFIGRRGVNRDITERKSAERELKNSHKKLVDLTMHIEEVREKERSKIALDLHDDLGQKITALNMDLVWLEKNIDKKNKKLNDKFVSMSNLLDDTLKSVKTISTELRPSILDDLGLIAAIEWLLSEFKKNSDINYSLDLRSEEINLNPDVSIIAFRMIQEGLTNIIRHANATKVNISIGKKDNMLNLILADNGVGVTKEQIENPDSFGLQGMQERAKSCGGNVQITGKPNKGSIVNINIPIKVKHND